MSFRDFCWVNMRCASFIYGICNHHPLFGGQFIWYFIVYQTNWNGNETHIAIHTQTGMPCSKGGDYKQMNSIWNKKSGEISVTGIFHTIYTHTHGIWRAWSELQWKEKEKKKHSKRPFIVPRELIRLHYVNKFFFPSICSVIVITRKLAIDFPPAFDCRIVVFFVSSLRFLSFGILILRLLVLPILYLISILRYSYLPNTNT